MINKLIEGIFFIINKIFTIIFTPFFTALFALFPQLSTFLTYITNFLALAVRYIGFISSLIFIPSNYWTMIFDYFVIKYSIFILAQGVKFIINVYNKLKP